MADVRSLLQKERASRRITHPHASYTSDGKLLCNLCETRVKTESAWQAHLHSSQHTLRSSRTKDAAERRGGGNAPDASKKRKAEALESSPRVERKKARAGADEHDADDRDSAAEDVAAAEITDARSEIAGSTGLPTRRDTASDAAPLPAEEAAANADEIAAFERDLADLEASMTPARPGTLTAAPAISAAAMTAEQLAARAREKESSGQERGRRREVEIEGEKEDAARRLEEELEEMEGLEERVRKLRERREGLKINGGGTVGVKEVEVAEDKAEEDVEESGEDEDDEDDVVWRFGT